MKSEKKTSLHHQQGYNHIGNKVILFNFWGCSRLIREVEARSEAWDGIGRSMWTEYHMKNGKYSYIVRHYVDRMSDEHEQSGDVEVIKAGKTLTSLKCIRF